MFRPTIMGDGCQAPPRGPFYVLASVPPKEVVSVAKNVSFFSHESREIDFFRVENAVVVDFHEAMSFNEISRLSASTGKDVIVRNELPSGAEFFARYTSHEEGEGEYLGQD